MPLTSCQDPEPGGPLSSSPPACLRSLCPGCQRWLSSHTSCTRQPETRTDGHTQKPCDSQIPRDPDTGTHRHTRAKTPAACPTPRTPETRPPETPARVHAAGVVVSKRKRALGALTPWLSLLWPPPLRRRDVCTRRKNMRKPHALKNEPGRHAPAPTHTQATMGAHMRALRQLPACGM